MIFGNRAFGEQLTITIELGLCFTVLCRGTRQLSLRGIQCGRLLNRRDLQKHLIFFYEIIHIDV
ncbi:Uncharacterised protein [Vibrio cholerae]|nr:Uncharacterised protein [Vibrio cholerae]CSC59774.1 Uncharacterised protein [Vibrio cholerae]